MKKFYTYIFLLTSLTLSIEAKEALYIKYADKSINTSSLVERQGLKYQVNTNSPFSGRFVTFEDDYGFCVSQAGSYKKGLLHGPFEEYSGCGALYFIKTSYKNGLEHGLYQEFDEGYLLMEGNMVNGLAEGEWIGYEYGQISWTEQVENDETVSYSEYLYYDNGQLSMKDVFNNNDELHGISEAYHQNGQLKSKIEYKNGTIVRIIEKYDFNGNMLN